MSLGNRLGGSGRACYPGAQQHGQRRGRRIVGELTEGFAPLYIFRLLWLIRRSIFPVVLSVVAHGAPVPFLTKQCSNQFSLATD